MTEKVSLLEERLMERQSKLIELFGTRYKSKKIGGELFFAAPRGRVFAVDTFPYYKSIFLEWADSFEKASGGRVDGDLYSIDLTEEEMIQAMLKEIEEKKIINQQSISPEVL